MDALKKFFKIDGYHKLISEVHGNKQVFQIFFMLATGLEKNIIFKKIPSKYLVPNYLMMNLNISTIYLASVLSLVFLKWFDIFNAQFKTDFGFTRRRKKS